MLLEQYPELLRAVDLGAGKFLIPTPRVGSTSMMKWAELSGFKPIDPKAATGRVATFVRNPYDRLVSARAVLWSHMSFEDFIWNIEQGAHDIHFAPQTTLIPEPEFVGKYETFSRDWQRFSEWAGVEYRPLPIMHTSMRYGFPVEEMYSPRLRDVVARIYAKDFEVYGYDPHLEARRPDAQRSGGAIH